MSTRQDKVLLTGGAGFVGSYLVKELLKMNYNVVVIDDLSNGKEENLTDEVEFYQIDISEAEELKKIPDYEYEIIIHCAAQSSNAISFLEPERDLLVNQLGTLNLLNYARRKNIKRFIFTSSMSAYGDPEILPTNEKVAMYPDSFYAVHKLSSEHYLRIFSKENGIDYTVFRLYTTYGHGQNLDNIKQGLLSIYLSYIIRKQTLVVKGSKDRTRDIIHVSDVVNAIILSIDNQKSFNKIYNLGTGKKITIEEIINQLTSGFGYKPGEYPIVYEENTPGDPFNTLADNSKAKSDLGWEPEISPAKGIELTINAYKNLRK